MWGFLTAFIPLFLMIYREYLSNEAKANQEKTDFDTSQAALKAIVDNAVNNWNALNQAKSKEAQKAWDAADEDKS